MHGLDIDSPETTRLRRRIIREKGFLRRIYQEWYRAISAELPSGDGAVLEIGSGAGFLDEFIPGLITSDTFHLPGISVVLDGHELPFAAGSMRAIVLLNALHHFSNSAKFFAEAVRCVRPGGAVILIEPWVSDWSRFIYKRIHHEPFDDETPKWEFQTSGPLSSANSALPWMIFERDAERFRHDFPDLHVKCVSPFMPITYILSGGVSCRSLMPAATYRFWRGLEKRMDSKKWAMFAKIVIVRTGDGNQTNDSSGTHS